MNDETLKLDMSRVGPTIKPTIQDAIAVVAEHFGLTKGQAMELMRTPTHPHGLRDTFAGQAMQGLLTSGHDFENSSEVAMYAFTVANSMMERREKNAR